MRFEKKPEIQSLLFKETTGTLLKKLKIAGDFNFDELSEALDNLRELQKKNGVNLSDFFTIRGSDSTAEISSELEGEHKKCILWSINHYLGLNRHPDVIESAVAAIRKFGTGSGTSAVSGGKNYLHEKVEKKVGEWLNKESVMIFPTGYTANLGLLAAICNENDAVIIDDECHASIRDGIRISSRKNWINFKHNSVEDLYEKLSQASQITKGTLLVVVESAYSMSGDICPLREIVKLKEIFDFKFFVDEAHSFGIYGEGGRGLCYQEGIIDSVDFLTSTFSKATASIGGFVATSKKYASYFQWAANTYAFQACIPPADAASILTAMEIIEKDNILINDLHSKNKYMRESLTSAGFDLRLSKTPVIPIYVSDTEKLIRLCFDLFKKGIFSVPVGYPMVAHNDGRIRLIVNARHTYEQIDETVKVLSELARKHNVIATKG